MHDRIIDDQVYVFGNAGGLYKNAMTWWDHETFSIWSQPTGEALSGPLKGTRLEPLPFQLTSWENWRNTHPDTLVMSTRASRMGAFKHTFNPDFVIGVMIDDQAKGYPYQIAAEEVIIEDDLGEFPVLIWAGEEDYRVYLRLVGNQELHFSWKNERLLDLETGSSWDPRLGIARQGELQGQVLQQLPSLSIYRSSWADFFPGSPIYSRE